jgi:hypothetical protein
MILTFTTSTSASAGADQTICDSHTATLAGSITGAAGGMWTTNGSGSFSPDASALNATYVPSSSDIFNQTVTLTLTTTGTGSCSSSSDDMVLTLEVCTGLISSTPKASNELKVYPSPSNSIVNVEARSGITITEISVTNSMQEEVGARILEMNNNTAVLDISDLSSGMYFVRIINGNSVTVQKVIKE